MGTISVIVGGLAALLAGMLITWRFTGTRPGVSLALLAFSVYLSDIKYDVGPVTIRPEQVIILVVLGVVAARFLVHGELPRVSAPMLFATGWWLALALSAFLHAPNFADTLRHILRLGLMVLGLAATANLARQEEDWRLLVTLLYVFGVLEAAYGLLALLLFLRDPSVNLGVQVTTSLPVPVPYGTVEEGNIFGSTMAALLMLSLALWLHPREIVPRYFSGLGVLLTAAGWLSSMTRGAWLAVLLLLPLFWVLYPARAERRFVHLGALILAAPVASVALAALLLFAPPTLPLISRFQTLAQLATDPTFNMRLFRWQLAWEDIRMRPFIGWGPGTFEQLHGLQYSRPAWLDSLTIKSAQESGLFGMIFMYGLWITTVFDGLYAALRQEGYPYRGTILGLTFGALALFLAYHATDATWLAFLWVWLGALIARPGGMWAQDVWSASPAEGR